MKAKELIEELQKVGPETEIQFNIQDGCCGDYIELDIIDSEFGTRFKDTKHEEDLARFMFAPLPGYNSCSQSGGTKRLDEKYWEKKPT
jgi:hypothetical protein